MDQTLDQVVKSRNIKFNGKQVAPGQQKKQFNNQNKMAGGKMFFQNRKPGFNQMKPRGNVVGNFGMKKTQFKRPALGNNLFQRRNQAGMMMQGQNFNNRRQNFNNQRQNFNNQRQNFPMRQNFNGQNFGGFIPQRRQNFGQNQQMQNAPRFNNQFQRNQMGFRAQQQQQRPMGNMMQNNNSNQNTKLYISNLDFGVTSQDIKELFSEFGPIVRYGVNFSQIGRSVGTAEVLFQNKISAVKAFKKYNQVTLDGRPMSLEVQGGVQQQQMSLRPIQQNQFRPRIQNQMMRQSPLKRLANNRPKPMNKPVNKSFNRQNLVAAMVKRAKNNVMTKKKPMMKGKMQAQGKKQVLDVNQLDADLEAYANSKD